MILLDTHVLIWFCIEPGQLSARSSRAVRQGFEEGGIAISDISLWEIAMLSEKGRIHLNTEIEAWFDTVFELPNLVALRITPVVAALSTNLPGEFHGDSADRIIVATSLTQQIPLVTKDQVIRRYRNVKTIW